jgi:hypothetical protein
MWSTSGILRDHLSFKSHISKVKTKRASSLFIFTKIRQLIPRQISWSLYHSMFKSHLTYCLLLWGNTHPSYLQPLNVVHNKFLRNLLFLPSCTPSSLLYKQASVLPLSSIYKYLAAIMIYKFFNLPHTIPLTMHNHNTFQISSRIHDHSTRARQRIQNSLPFTKHFKPQTKPNLYFGSYNLG